MGKSRGVFIIIISSSSSNSSISNSSNVPVLVQFGDVLHSISDCQ